MREEIGDLAGMGKGDIGYCVQPVLDRLDDIRYWILA